VYNNSIAHKTVFLAGLHSQKIERKFLAAKYGNYVAYDHCKSDRVYIQDEAVHPYQVFSNLIFNLVTTSLDQVRLADIW